MKEMYEMLLLKLNEEIKRISLFKQTDEKTQYICEGLFTAIGILNEVDNELKNRVCEARPDYEAMCHDFELKLKECNLVHDNDRAILNDRIAELEQELMVFREKWSVIQLIFGK